MERGNTPSRPPYSPIASAAHPRSPARRDQETTPPPPTVSRFRAPNDFPVPESVQRDPREGFQAWDQDPLAPPPMYSINPPMGRPNEGYSTNPLENRPMLPPPYPPLPDSHNLAEHIRALTAAGVGMSPTGTDDLRNLSPARSIRAPERFVPLRASGSPGFSNVIRPAAARGERELSDTPPVTGARLPKLARSANRPGMYGTPTPTSRVRPADRADRSAVGGTASRLVRSAQRQEPRTPGQPVPPRQPEGGGVALNTMTPGWEEIAPGTNQTERSSAVTEPSPARPLRLETLREEHRPPTCPQSRAGSGTESARSSYVSRASHQSARPRFDPYPRRHRPREQQTPPRPRHRFPFDLEEDDRDLDLVLLRRSRGRDAGVHTYRSNFSGTTTVNGVSVQGFGPVYVFPDESGRVGARRVPGDRSGGGGGGGGGGGDGPPAPGGCDHGNHGDRDSQMSDYNSDAEADMAAREK